jgi:hypothetical protein
MFDGMMGGDSDSDDIDLMDFTAPPPKKKEENKKQSESLPI